MKKIVLDKTVVQAVNQRERQYFKLRQLEIAQDKALGPVREEIVKKARSVLQRLLRHYCEEPGLLLDELLPERGSFLLFPSFRRVSPEGDPFGTYCMDAPPQLEDFIVTKTLERVLKTVELPEERRYREDAEFLVFEAIDDAYIEYGYGERFLSLLWTELVTDAMTVRELEIRCGDEEE